MHHQQDRAQNLAYSGQRATPSSLRNRKCDKDSNFNFLPDRGGGEGVAAMIYAVDGGDENHNQTRPRNLGPPPPPPTSSSSAPGRHCCAPGPLSPLSRTPCWSPLEPLPEVESGDDGGYGRVSPDGEEEGKMMEEEEEEEEEEEGREGQGEEEEEEERGRMLENGNEEERGRGKRWGDLLLLPSGREGGGEDRRREEEEEEEEEEEWGDSDSDFDFRGSMSSLNTESGGEVVLMGGWGRVSVGEPTSNHSHHQGGDDDYDTGMRANLNGKLSATARRRGGVGRGALSGNASLGQEDHEHHRDQSSDSEATELPELLEAVWTLRERERFKAQEMEKHQVQLTMYRRLALIRWVRALQGRVQEQQNRLQASFDVILTHRKELLRMGAAATIAAAAPPAAVGQS